MEQKKISTIVSLALIIITILTISVVSFYSFWDKNTISEEENRTLAQKPEISVENWLNGTFVNELNLFLNDHVLMRKEIIDKATDMESMLKKEQAIQVMTSNNERKDIGSDVLILEDKILALYIKNQDYMDSIIEASNDLFDLMPEGVNKYMMLSPARIEFEDEEIKQYADSQLESIYEIYAGLNKDVKTVDSYSLLQFASQTVGIDKLYFKTDHHWTAYGASFGANALLSAMGKSIILPENYTEINAGDFLGYLAVMHSNDIGDLSPESFVYYDCAQEIYEYAYGVEGADLSESKYQLLIDGERAGYYTFVERSYQYVVIEGGDKDGGNLLMINDSFGNAMVPWMASQYNKIVMIDPRLYEGGNEGFMQLIDDYEITDFVISLAGLISGSSFGGEMAKLCQ